MTDIIFIGAGPIGLLGAIQLKLQCPEKEILMFEKYEVPLRNHAMYVSQSSFAGMDRSKGFGDLLDGISSNISLRIFIDEPTYQSMKQATFKTPYTLMDKDKIPPKLFKTISNYLKGREHLVAETIEENSLKISTITLSIYASKNFCTEVEGKTFFQIGEEAFACPFYRSFNDNASCIPSFTKAMKALFENNNVVSNKISSNSIFKHSTSENDPLEYYEHEVQGLVNSEIRTIHALNFGIKMLESSVTSTQSAPQIFSSKLILKREGKTFLDEVNRDRKTDNETSSMCILS